MRQNVEFFEVEASVLGCLICGGDYYEIGGVISANDFHNPDHAKVYQAIEKAAINGEPYDAITLLDKGIDISAVNKVKEYHATPQNISHYAKLLASYSAKRKTAKILQAALGNLDHSQIMEQISGIQLKLDNIVHTQIQESKNWTETIKEGISALDDRSINDENLIFTGLSDLDSKLRAIHGSRLLIFAARPSVGKTALAQQIALRSAENGKCVGIISLEMNCDELAIRSIANQFELNGTLLSRGSTEELNKFVSAYPSTHFMDYKIHIDDKTDSLSGILARISEWKRKYNIDFAIIDHIGLISQNEFNSRSSRNDELGKVSRSLKKLCKKLSMPIIALCQLNRLSEREKRSRPLLSDLRDSGNIEQDADFVMFLQRSESLDAEFSKSVQRIQMYIEKNRNGPIGPLSECGFNGQTQRFSQF